MRHRAQPGSIRGRPNCEKTLLSANQVLAEMWAADPNQRMSAFALNVAEHPERVPVMITEAPGRAPDMAKLARLAR